MGNLLGYESLIPEFMHPGLMRRVETVAREYLRRRAADQELRRSLTPDRRLSPVTSSSPRTSADPGEIEPSTT
ncbi:hypothetical protein [Nocardia sp. NPDC057440]|uniref:hypothetical protein n=1 Tax=Nocardia sp. NPDC057440 TaxID=3346134 RepID=UPI00366D6322